MIALNNLSVYFSGKYLFKDVTFTIQDKDRIGLVGKNGAGKSTLMKMIAGQQEGASGQMTIASEQTIGYLPQEIIPDTTRSVMDEALTAFSEMNSLEEELIRLGEDIAQATDYESTSYQKKLMRLHDLNEQLHILGAYTRQEETEKVLIGLGFSRTDFLRSMTEFSSGWQMRVELAKILLKKPDFVLLDEPTNHLDIESIQWLESFLDTYSGAVLLVSHDRTFLDNITRRTIEISAGSVYDYKASYSEYVVLMEERRQTQAASQTSQQKEIADIESFVDRFRAKASKAKQVQSRLKLLEKMDRIQIDEQDTSSIRFRFPPAPHSGKVLVEMESLTKKYGKKTVLSGIDLLISRGEKVAFVGKNGEGKSTLAKIIVGEIQDYTGTYKEGHQVQIAYFAQNQAALLNPDLTVFETIDQIAVGEVRTKVRNILGSFLFSGDDVQKKVKVLSGGEKTRLALAKLLLTPSNLLVLDEPTNHLDMRSKDVLKNALLQYDGTLIVVSHDRDFLAGLTDLIMEFREGAIKTFHGDIFEFLEARKLDSLKALEAEKKQNSKAFSKEVATSSKRNYGQNKEWEKELKKIKTKVEKAENQIAVLEKEVLEKESQLSLHPEKASDTNFYQAYALLKENVSKAYLEWEVLLVTLSEFESQQ